MAKNEIGTLHPQPKKDAYKTVVIFRKFKESGDILALFPYEKGNPGFCMSYMHLGQHSEADYQGCLRITVPAKRDEYKDLLEELKSVGYDPEIRQKIKR